MIVIEKGTPRGGWQPASFGRCPHCGREMELNEEGLCRDGAFVAKMHTISIQAVPWGLREVRRQHGISGETDRASEERKARHEADEDTPSPELVRIYQDVIEDDGVRMEYLGETSGPAA